MPAQSARSLTSWAALPDFSGSVSSPRTHSLSPLVHAGSTWFSRRWTRVGGEGWRRTQVSCSSPPERLHFIRISRRAHVPARPGGRHPEGPVQENQPRGAQGSGMGLACLGPDLEPADESKVQPSPRTEFGSRHTRKGQILQA